MRVIARASPEKRKRLIQEMKDAAGAPAEDKHRMTVQDTVQQFERKVTRTLQAFGEWPQLIFNESYHQQVILTIYDLKQYILHIEGVPSYEWDYGAQKIAL